VGEVKQKDILAKRDIRALERHEGMSERVKTDADPDSAFAVETLYYKIAPGGVGTARRRAEIEGVWTGTPPALTFYYSSE